MVLRGLGQTSLYLNWGIPNADVNVEGEGIRTGILSLGCVQYDEKI
jgi:hypothetical protein